MRVHFTQTRRQIKFIRVKWRRRSLSARKTMNGRIEKKMSASMASGIGRCCHRQNNRLPRVFFIQSSSSRAVAFLMVCRIILYRNTWQNQDLPFVLAAKISHKHSIISHYYYCYYYYCCLKRSSFRTCICLRTQQYSCIFWLTRFPERYFLFCFCVLAFFGWRYYDVDVPWKNQR